MSFCRFGFHGRRRGIFLGRTDADLRLFQVLGGEGVVVKDEGAQDAAAGTVYSLEDGRRDQGQESGQESMAGFGQVGRPN